MIIISKANRLEHSHQIACGSCIPVDSCRRTPDEVTLALDLGTHTGWAMLAEYKIIVSGTEILATEDELLKQRREGKERTFDVRFRRLLLFIRRKIAAGASRIVFEDVQFSKSQMQTQLWASLRAAVWTAALQMPVQVRCVSVPTLKFFATGNGKATKSEMAKALADVEPTIYWFDTTTGLLHRGNIEIDDNEVDAIWLARFAAAVDQGKQQFRGL